MNSEPAERLLARASVYQLLALGYVYPSTGQRRRMSAMLDDTAPWIEVLDEPWPSVMSALGTPVAEASQHEVEEDFNRLFSGPVECPPHETAYEPDVFRRQRALADISGFYRAFGFDLDGESRWQPDHIGVQLEFCSILLQRHAQALEEGWTEPAEICDEAVREFLADHLGRWHGSFGPRLGRFSTAAFYQVLGDLTHRWVSAEVGNLRLHPEPLADRPRVAPDDVAPPACGACPVAPGATR